jgi:hypothetical protein
VAGAIPSQFSGIATVGYHYDMSDFHGLLFIFISLVGMNNNFLIRISTHICKGNKKIILSWLSLCLYPSYDMGEYFFSYINKIWPLSAIGMGNAKLMFGFLLEEWRFRSGPS